MGARKTRVSRYGNNSPTPYAWRPLRQLLLTCCSFLGFIHTRRRHNASFFKNVADKIVLIQLQIYKKNGFQKKNNGIYFNTPYNLSFFLYLNMVKDDCCQNNGTGECTTWTAGQVIILLYSIMGWYENHPQKTKQDSLLPPLMNSNPSQSI